MTSFADTPFLDARMRPVRAENAFKHQEPKEESHDEVGRHWALGPRVIAAVCNEVAAGVHDVPAGYEQLSLETVCNVVWQCQQIRSRRQYGAPAVVEAFRPNGKQLPLESWAGGDRGSDVRVSLGRQVTPGTFIVVEIESYPVPVAHGQYSRPSFTDVHEFAKRDARQIAEWYHLPSPPGVESPCWRAGEPIPEPPPPIEEKPLSQTVVLTILATVRREVDDSLVMSDAVRPEMRERRLVFDPSSGQLVGRGLVPSGFGRYSDWPPSAFVVFRFAGLRPDEVEDDLGLVRVGADGRVRWVGTPAHLIPA